MEELMTGEGCVVYSNDGSAQGGMGNYVVQSLSISGVQKNLLTFGIFTDKRETLADLVKCTIQILSAVSAYKYSISDILKMITFIMSDSAAHNLKVMEVCEDEGVENNPFALLCNIHPLMMFQRKIKEFCQELHMIGKNRIKECFLVDIDFHSESFAIKSIKCLLNVICEEYSTWNGCSQFGGHIKPKKCMTISFKDHWLNRLLNCCCL